VLSENEDVCDLSTARKRLMLTLNIAQCDVGIWLSRGHQGLLTFEFQVSMSNHHKLDMAFNSEQIPHLIMTPAQRLLGNAVEILDFPPAPVVADDSLGRERLIGANKIAPLLQSDDTIDDQFDAVTTRQATRPCSKRC